MSRESRPLVVREGVYQDADPRDVVRRSQDELLEFTRLCPIVNSKGAESRSSRVSYKPYTRIVGTFSGSRGVTQK
jgi:hypothetical protein